MKQLDVIVRFVDRAPATADDFFREVAGNVVRNVDRTTIDDVVQDMIDVAVHDVVTAPERATDAADKDVADD